MIRGSRGIERSHSSNASRTTAHTYSWAPTWSGNNREQFRPFLYHITKRKDCLFSLHASAAHACSAPTIIDYEVHLASLRELWKIVSLPRQSGLVFSASSLFQETDTGNSEAYAVPFASILCQRNTPLGASSSLCLALVNAVGRSDAVSKLSRLRRMSFEKSDRFAWLERQTLSGLSLQAFRQTIVSDHAHRRFV